MIDEDHIRTIHEDVARYYSEKLSVHGPTAQGVDWKDAKSQELRHRQFLRLVGEDRRSSVGDVGCGHGDFFRFLRSNDFVGRYIGCDVSEPMIATARQLYGTTADHRFVIGATVDEPVDYVVASGIFNVKQGCPDDLWQAYIDQAVDAMAKSARRGFGFNILSLHSDPERRRLDLYYSDPAGCFARMAERYGRNIALLQDYGLFEFTLLVRIG
jgi:SAM-dependent methyltransferase